MCFQILGFFFFFFGGCGGGFFKQNIYLYVESEFFPNGIVIIEKNTEIFTAFWKT